MASLGWKTVADWVRAVWAFIKEHPWRFWVPLALAVVGGVLDGLVPTAHEIGRLLPYGAYVGVGVLSAAWFTLMVADWPFAVMWHLVDDYSTERALPRILALWNRQVGRLQAVATLATLVFIVWPSRFHLASFGFFLWLLLFGSKVVDAIVGHLVENPDDLSWARRVLLYGITLFGTGVLMAVAPHQIVAIMRFLLVAWVGLAIRIAYWLRGLVDRKLRFNQAPRRTDAALIALLLAGMAAPLVPIVNVHVTVGASDQAQRTSLVQSCGWTADGPGDPPDVSLFLVADSQFHTLYGARTQGHTELVDRLVPVAVRPIELDLLSFAPLRRFAGAYHALKESGRAKMKWAHLGDYGDLGCVPEIERFGAYAKLFGEDLAALSPGNHDSTYIGNFDWHPDWDRVCQRLGTKEPARRLDKGKADAMLLAAARPLIDPTATTVALVEHPVTSWTQVEKNALVWVSRLGESHGREVIGAFLDSSDFTTFALGAAGEQGSVSELQADWFIAQLGLHPRALVVLFMHHPLDEISILGRSRVERVAASLGPRLLAVVSAHTHLAAFRGHRLAGRAVPEFVIGSTIDPPEEAALLEIGPNAQGVYSVRVRTLPSVTRDQLDCHVEHPPPLSGEGCRTVVAGLRANDACKPVFEWSLPPDTDPTLLRQHQADRSRALFACLCREGRCPVPLPGKELDDNVVYPTLEKTFTSLPEAAEEMTCLAWVASVLQGHKAEPRFNFGSAADVAFDPSNPPVGPDDPEPAVPTASGIAFEVADAPPPGP